MAMTDEIARLVEKGRQELAMARILDNQWRNPRLGPRRRGSPFEDKVRACHAAHQEELKEGNR